MATCKLTVVHGPDCDFQATAGQNVTLQILEVPGGGLIDFDAGTKYAGQDVPGTPSKTITFTIAAGSNDLEIVYLFSQPDNGRGELHESCDRNPFLDFIRAASKTPVYTICA
jgi:subtilase family serine protease